MSIFYLYLISRREVVGLLLNISNIFAIKIGRLSDSLLRRIKFHNVYFFYNFNVII